MKEQRTGVSEKRTNDPREAIGAWLQHWQDIGEFRDWSKEQKTILAEAMLRNYEAKLESLPIETAVVRTFPGFRGFGAEEGRLVQSFKDNYVTALLNDNQRRANFDATFGVSEHGPSYGWLSLPGDNVPNQSE